MHETLIRQHNRYKWEVECEYLGCREHCTHDRWTVSGVQKQYCRKHYEQAVLLFGEHQEPRHVGAHAQDANA